MRKTDFKPFKVGTVFNIVGGGPYKATLKRESIKIRYPSRLNLMAIDPSKIATNRNLVYTPGEVILKVKIYKTVHICVDKKSSKITISPRSKRQSLILHSALIMKKALGSKYGLSIDVDNETELRHVGFGSSSALIAAVASAINELFGKPIKSANLIKYLAQNHGEEIDRESDLINPVQCIGGSAAGGQYPGALMILTGESCVIKTMAIKDGYKVIIGIPKDFVELDSEELLKKERTVFHKFIRCGKLYGPTIAYKVLHSVLPAMVQGDLKTIGNLIYEYRFKMGSIDNCSYTYPRLNELAAKLKFLKEKKNADILSISSVGPAFVAVSKNPEKCRAAFERENLVSFITEPENKKYRILKE